MTRLRVRRRSSVAPRLVAALLAAALASAPDAVAGTVAPGAVAAGPAAAGPRAAGPGPGEAVAGARPLALSAKALADAGRPKEAWRALLEGLATDLPALAGGRGAPVDAARARAEAEAEVAVLLLTHLAQILDAWPETETALALLRRHAGELPPELAFRIDHLRAQCLRAIGHADDARGLMDAQGMLTAFLVIGPFDNERGAGFHVAQPPEEAITYVAPESPDDPGDPQELPGKVRPVHWREMPGRHHPLGRLLLHEVMRPDEQVLGYLATALQSERDRDVVLHFGTAGDVKVFLNGEELFARRVERPPFADQDAVVLPLVAGTNVLLVKLGVETGAWTFEARLTELDGRPVIDVPAGGERIGWSPPVARATDARPAPGTREVLEGAADDDADAARLAALWHLLLHPDDVVDRHARAAVLRALASQPDDVATLYLLAQASEPEGASLHEMEVNQRLDALHEVLARDPDHVEALLDLAEFYSGANPQPDRADELTARALAAAPDDWRALISRGRYLRTRGRQAEADVLLRRAEACPEALWRSEGWLARADRERREGRPEQERALLAQAFDRRVLPGPVADRLIGRLVDLGRDEEAVTVVDRALWAAPLDTDIALRTARLLERGPMWYPATRLVERVLDICPEHIEARLDRARLNQRYGHPDVALADLRRVLELDPGNDATRRRLELMTPDADAAFEGPWRRDAEELVGTPRPEAGDESLEVLDRTVVWRVHGDGTEDRYEHVVWRPLNALGVKQLDTVVLPAPARASVQILNVRVLRPDGTSERAPAPRWKREGSRWFDLPPLRAGDLVDVEFRVNENGPDEFGRYFGTRHLFYPDRVDPRAPTRRSELVVIAPADLELYTAERNADGLEHARERTPDGHPVLRWVAHDLPRPVVQAAMPRPEEWAPLVDVTTYPDWDAFARWWWSFIEKEFVTTPPMRAKVAELVDGLDTEEQRVAAIERFVAQEIRYNAWPFGTHGYEPFSAATIFERRFGDCKDKSILMRQLLAEIGVEAVPVLLSAESFRSDDPLDAAMVGHFNHCITWLPPTDRRPGYYLDATADLNPVRYLRADDQGARALHVTSDGGELHDIPYAPPEDNALRRTWTVELRPDGAGLVTLVDESSGRWEVRLRGLFGGERGDMQQALAREVRSALGGVDVLSVDTTDLEDTSAPARLEARFAATSLWTTEGEQRALRPGFDDLGLQGVAAEPPEQRKWEVVLDRPMAHETTVEWVLPEGWEPAELPADVVVDAPGLLEYRQSVERTAKGIAVHRRYVQHARRIGLDRYADFRDALSTVRQAEERAVLIAPRGSDG